MGEELGRSAALKFLEFLGQLARDAELSILEDFPRSFERLGESVRRFKIDRCFFACPGRAELALALTALDW